MLNTARIDNVNNFISFQVVMAKVALRNSSDYFFNETSYFIKTIKTQCSFLKIKKSLLIRILISSLISDYKTLIFDVANVNLKIFIRVCVPVKDCYK